MLSTGHRFTQPATSPRLLNGYQHILRATWRHTGGKPVTEVPATLPGLEGGGGEGGGEVCNTPICSFVSLQSPQSITCESLKICETSPTSFFFSKRKEKETIYNFFGVV